MPEKWIITQFPAARADTAGTTGTAGSFPPWSAVPEAAALLVVGLGLHDWTGTLGLTRVCVAYRGLYGAWRHVFGYTVAVLAAAAGAVKVLAISPASAL